MATEVHQTAGESRDGVSLWKLLRAVLKILQLIVVFLLRRRVPRDHSWPPEGAPNLPAAECRIADLHAHYAMQRLPDLYNDPRVLLQVALDPRRVASAAGPQPAATAAEALASAAVGTVQLDPATRLRAFLLALANALMNSKTPSSKPAVRLELMKEGGVGIIFSPVYDFFDEVVDAAPGTRPKARYFDKVCRQLDFVECKLLEEEKDTGAPWTQVVTCREHLDEAIKLGRIAFIHAVEGGFHLGPEESELDRRACELKSRGVAYVTLAHLVPRGVADNAPSVPFLCDLAYNSYFGDLDTGLTPLGEAAVLALARHRILVDVTHMSNESILDVFRTLENSAAGDGVPVIATHMACRMTSGREYNLSDGTIQRIAERRGVVGVIFCDHWMRESPNVSEKGFKAVQRHIDRIHALTKTLAAPDVHEYAAIGSDFDGFIKPTLSKLDHMGQLSKLRAFLVDTYGEDNARRICWDNVCRVLEWVWPRQVAHRFPLA